MITTKFPTMFKRDPETKLVIPELDLNCLWVRESARARMSLMLDGYCCVVTSVKGENAIFDRKDGEIYRRRKILKDGVIVVQWDKLSRDIQEDVKYWIAYDKGDVFRTGIYEFIGPDAKNNPHRIKENKFICVSPCSSAITPTYGDHGIKWMTSTSDAMLYEQIKAELSKPDCNVEGIVVQEEEWTGGKPNIIRACRVKKRDFGIVWPAPVPATVNTVPAQGGVTAAATYNYDSFVD